MARRRYFRMRKGVNIPRVVSKIAGTVLALYAGGIVISELGSVMNCTRSPFYDGLTLIGWTIEDNVNTTSTCTGASGLVAGTGTENDNVITATGSAGVLAVVGIIGIASIVMEFVKFRM